MATVRETYNYRRDRWCSVWKAVVLPDLDVLGFSMWRAAVLPEPFWMLLMFVDFRCEGRRCCPNAVPDVNGFSMWKAAVLPESFWMLLLMFVNFQCEGRRCYQMLMCLDFRCEGRRCHPNGVLDVPGFSQWKALVLPDVDVLGCSRGRAAVLPEPFWMLLWMFVAFGCEGRRCYPNAVLDVRECSMWSVGVSRCSTDLRRMLERLR